MDVGCVDATNKIVFVTVEKNIFDWMADGNKTVYTANGHNLQFPYAPSPSGGGLGWGSKSADCDSWQYNPTVSTKRLFSIMELTAEIGGTK